ncbi:hypothetical protein [Cellulomonas soli]
MTRVRRALVLAVASLVLALLGAQVAQAAALGFQPARPGFFTSTLARCTDATVTATPGPGTGNQRSGVRLVVPAACAGVTGSVLLVRSNGGAVASAVTFSVPAGFTGGTLTVPYGNTGNPAQYNAASVTGAVLTLDTWRVRAAWAFVPTTEPITPTTAGTTVSQQSWATQSATAFCVGFTITNTTASPVAWVLDLDLAQAPFNIPAGTSVRSDRYNLTSGTTQLQPLASGSTTSQPVAAPAPYTVAGGHLLLQGPGGRPPACSPPVPPPRRRSATRPPRRPRSSPPAAPPTP